MSAMKELYMEANDEYVKWTYDKAVGNELNIDIWVEAYMLGYANGMKNGVESSWKTTWNREKSDVLES